MNCGEITLQAAPASVGITLTAAPNNVGLTLKGCDMGSTIYEHFAPSDADDFLTANNIQFIVLR